MESAGAYGGVKAGGAYNIIAFAQRPQVILRAVCWLFAIIVFGCISSQGWRYDKKLDKEVCLFGNSSGCTYGVGIGVLGFLLTLAFLAGEFFFDQISCVKTRKKYVMADFGVSALWAFMNFIGFWMLASQWSDAPYPENGYGVSNMRAAITFTFFSIFTWAGCAYYAYLRYRQGVGEAFATNYEAESGMPGAYPSYPGADQLSDQQYGDQPFGGGQYGQQQQQSQFQAPAY